MRIACIVEGPGEEQAVPILVRRIIQEVDPAVYVEVVTAVVFKGNDKFRDRAQLTRAVRTASLRAGVAGAVLIVLDSEGDCPARFGPSILAWAQTERSDLPISVVVAAREYEAWFLAAAGSLQGHRGLSIDLAPPPDPEAVQGAKEWLSMHMPRHQPYSPTTHQASFSQAMSLEQARRAPSFDKLCRDVRRLVDAMRQAGT